MSRSTGKTRAKKGSTVKVFPDGTSSNTHVNIDISWLGPWHLKKKTFIISNIKVNKEDLRLGTVVQKLPTGGWQTEDPDFKTKLQTKKQWCRRKPRGCDSENTSTAKFKCLAVTDNNREIL